MGGTVVLRVVFTRLAGQPRYPVEDPRIVQGDPQVGGSAGTDHGRGPQERSTPVVAGPAVPGNGVEHTEQLVGGVCCERTCCLPQVRCPAEAQLIDIGKDQVIPCVGKCL